MLGGDFAILLLVDGNWNSLAKLETQLQPLGERLGLTITARRTSPKEPRRDLLPYGIGTDMLLNATVFEQMKIGAILVSCGSGSTIDETALAAAVRSGRLAGAALDVLSSEPPASDNPLLQAKNCLITPHIAWATLAARQRLMVVTAGNVRAFLVGKPEHVVN